MGEPRVHESPGVVGATDSHAESRQLGTPTAMAIVVANTFGTGIFVTSGLLARELGDARLALAAWLVGGLLALAGASAYAELGAMFPRAGGEYVYLSRAFHPAVGFVSGCVSIVVGFAASIAASAVVSASHLHALFPRMPVREGAIFLILLPTIVHATRLSTGARAQTFVTGLEVVLVATFAFVALAFGHGHASHFAARPSEPPGSGGFALALVLVSFAYSGFGAAGYVAGELRDPGRTLPRALLGGTGLVTVLYVLLNLAFYYGASPGRLGAEPEIAAHVAARALFGEGLGSAVSGVIALALFSSIGAMILAGPRVPAAMARDGLFFEAFARRNRGGSPSFGLAVQALLAIALVFTSSFEALLTYVGFLLGVFSALAALGALLLRLREPDRERPYRAPFLVPTAGLFVLVSVWVAAAALYERPEAGLYGLFTIGLCTVLYGLRERERRRDRALPRA